jgi:hypothetical protein
MRATQKSDFGGDQSAHADRVLPLTRWVGIGIVPFLVLAFIFLYFFPDNTSQLWAWTITPRMTPLFMGAGYLAGAYFFLQTFLTQRWHRIAPGYPAITTFAWCMGLATVLHWDRFNHSHISFFTWAALYAIAPFLVPALWMRNRSTDPGTAEPGDVNVPTPVRWIIGTLGGIEIALAVLMFLQPNLIIPIWPWKVTLLTARVLAGWLALTGVALAVIARDARWSAWRILLQTEAMRLGLTLVAIPRAWGDWNAANPLTWVFIVGSSLFLIGILSLHFSLDRRHPRP